MSSVRSGLIRKLHRWSWRGNIAPNSVAMWSNAEMCFGGTWRDPDLWLWGKCDKLTCQKHRLVLWNGMGVWDHVNKQEMGATLGWILAWPTLCHAMFLQFVSATMNCSFKRVRHAADVLSFCCQLNWWNNTNVDASRGKANRSKQFQMHY